MFQKKLIEKIKQESRVISRLKSVFTDWYVDTLLGALLSQRNRVSEYLVYFFFHQLPKFMKKVW